MRTLLRALTACALMLLCNASSAQSKFEFACVCDYVFNDSCDICDDFLLTRSFSGLMITIDNNVVALIDAPYVVIEREGEILEFREIGVGQETFLASRFATDFFTMKGFRDSTNCNCNAFTPAPCDSTQLYIVSDTLFLRLCDSIYSVAIPFLNIGICDSLALYVVSDTLYFSICDTTLSVKLPPTGVTSVGLDMPASEFDVTNSPVTGSGTLTASWKTQVANRVFAGPASGGPAIPTFRALVAADLPGQLLPPGALNQTLRYDGSAWAANNTIRIDASNRVGVGAAAPAAGRTLNYQNNATENARFTTTTNSTSGIFNAFEKITTLTPASASTAVVRGMLSEITGNATSGSITQIDGAVYSASGTNGSFTNIYGLSGNAVASTGLTSASNVIGLSGNSTANVGTVQNSIGVLGVNAMGGTASVNSSVGLYTYMSGSGTGTLTNRRGLWVRQNVGALSNTIVNHWGIQISALNLGTTIRAIETEGAGVSRHWDRFTIGNNNTFPAQLYVRGDGNTSATYGLIVTNSNAATATASLAVRNDGLVGIGTNTPTNTIHVVGTARVTASGSTAATITGRDATNVVTDVAVGSGLSLTSGTLSANDNSSTNEIQTISASGAGPSAFNIDLDLGGGSVTLQEGAGVDLTRSGNTITVAALDASATNEIQTISASGAGPSAFNIDLDLGGGSVTLQEGAGVDLTRSGNTITIAALDASATNEIQTISASGAGPSSFNIDLNLGGGSVTLQEGAGVDLTRSGNTITVAATNNGTVTSVGLALPTSEFTVTGSPVTGAGTLTGSWNNQTANRVFAGPASGGPAVPTFRALTTADLPAGVGSVTSVGLSLPASVFSISGSPVTGAGTLTGSFNNQTANTFFAGPASGGPAVPTFRTIQADDLPASAILPAGTVDQSLRHNGTSWVANSLLRIGTSAISVNTALTAASISSSNTITTATGLNRGHSFVGAYQPASSSTGSYSSGYFSATKSNSNNYNNLYAVEGLAVNQAGAASNMVAAFSGNVQRTGGSAGRFYALNGLYSGSGGGTVGEAGGAYVKLESTSTGLTSAYGYRYAGTAITGGTVATAIGFSSEQAGSSVTEHIDFYSSPTALSSDSWGFRGDNTSVKNKFAGRTIIGNTSSTPSSLFVRGESALGSDYALFVTNNSGATATASISVNNARETGFGSTPLSGFRLYSNGPTRTDGTAVVRGSGNKAALFSGLGNAAVRLWNTVGQTWYMHSADSLHFELYNNGIDVNRPSFRVNANSGFATTRGLEVHRQTMSVFYFTGAGTGPSTIELVGGPSAMQFTFNTGTSPAANQPIFQIVFVGSHLHFPIISLTPANPQTATDISKFYYSGGGNNTFTIRANGTLSASTQYSFHIVAIGQ